jgi:phosphoglycolate phosphatase
MKGGGGDMVSVIFDLDGTLIDSVADIHAAVNRLLAEQGLAPLSRAVVQGFVGNGVPVLMERLLRAVGLPEGTAQQAGLTARFLEIYETAHDLTTVYPGVEAALELLLRDGHPLGLCTNKPLGPTRAVLRRLGLERFFAVIVAGDSLAERKPHPAPLWAAVRDLGGGPAVFVGDSEVDAETAMAADVPFLLFTRGYRKSAVEAIAHRAAFDDFAALPDLIKPGA